VKVGRRELNGALRRRERSSESLGPGCRPEGIR
jgi:hypothetical protein